MAKWEWRPANREAHRTGDVPQVSAYLRSRASSTELGALHHYPRRDVDRYVAYLLACPLACPVLDTRRSACVLRATSVL